MRLIFGCLVFAGLACWSSMNPHVDMIMCRIVLGGVALVAIYGLLNVIVGEIALWWECIKPNPVADRKPRETV